MIQPALRPGALSRIPETSLRLRHRSHISQRDFSLWPISQELGTTWPSLRKAFTRHGLGMPARNREAVRRRAIDGAHKRHRQPPVAAVDPVFVALNQRVIPVRARSGEELAARVRRAEDYAVLGADAITLPR